MALSPFALIGLYRNYTIRWLFFKKKNEPIAPAAQKGRLGANSEAVCDANANYLP